MARKPVLTYVIEQMEELYPGKLWRECTLHEVAGAVIVAYEGALVAWQEEKDADG